MTKYLTQKQIDDFNKIKSRIDKYAILLKVFYSYEFNSFDINKQKFIRKEIDRFLCG